MNDLGAAWALGGVVVGLLGLAVVTLWLTYRLGRAAWCEVLGAWFRARRWLLEPGSRNPYAPPPRGRVAVVRRWYRRRYLARLMVARGCELDRATVRRWAEVLEGLGATSIPEDWREGSAVVDADRMSERLMTYRRNLKGATVAPEEGG